MDDLTQRRRGRIRFLIVAGGVLLAGLAGFIASRSVPGGDAAGGAMVLAAATGFGAFFSPCSFPLLLTILARPPSGSGSAARVARIAAGVTVTFGAITVIFVAGGLAAGNIVGSESSAGRAFRIAVGTFLVLLGLRQAGRLLAGGSWLDRIAGAAGSRLDMMRHRSLGSRDFLYGAAYLLIGFG